MSTGKGKKRTRNIPVLHEQVKEQHSIMFTPATWKKLQALAIDADLSVSEYLETLIRAIDGD
ncbi:hypothetical protein WA1_11100 [Scytonema hofmannii PCC 7110]|uniref:CopG family transcriptional regulator n=1 Tax=Scytonema hofmannii PCC 7110 TaxID=128403 RepID=A0A139XFJ1_9CYAN|nr:hypothetical protein [Scytonema hofmannii]KYC43465.1 hypothetical protein WA1_11100 [Scytonema hofmannii PCC 7110]